MVKGLPRLSVPGLVAFRFEVELLAAWKVQDWLRAEDEQRLGVVVEAVDVPLGLRRVRAYVMVDG